MARGLTEKQKRFCDEYLIDFNGTRAYLTAYPACKSSNAAKTNACRTLGKPHVMAYIEKRMKDRERRTEITQDRVLQEYARIGLFDPRKLFHDDGRPKNISELDDDTAAALAGLDVQETYEFIGGEKTFTGYLKKYKTVIRKVRLIVSPVISGCLQIRFGLKVN